PDEMDRVSHKLSNRFRTVFMYAGCDGLAEHDLRHEATCRWYEMRNPRTGDWMFREVEIPGMMGWAPGSKMPQRYASFRAEDLAGLRGLVGDFEMGQEFLGKPNIEYRMLYAEDNITALGYRYAVALPVLGLAGETKATVKGRVAVGKRWSGSKKVNFAFTIRKDGENPDAESYICDGSEFPVEFSSTTRQVSLIFGADALFDVNAQNQQPLNVGISNTPFTDYALKYPDIKLKFVIFTHNPIFDRRGILSIFAPSGSFLYEITPNGPLLRENLYDEEKKAFVINTHRLGEYVVTDKKLPIGRKLGRVENPPTGKNA
ncbi:MAG: hypothetical protein RR315_07105, partial [Oscillospiraceae bacterium]